jgi:predicted amidohydrolase
MHRVRNACFDVTLSNAEFVKNHEFWNRNGVYAVFASQTPLGFRASELNGIARYRALENYDFTLEFGLAGPSSDGVSVIVSPEGSIIDQAESFLFSS